MSPELRRKKSISVSCRTSWSTSGISRTPASDSAAVEQFHAVGLFQRADLRGHGRLGKAELLGGQRDAAQAGDHEEGFELRDEHAV
jgi:hypothetical protein